MSTTPAFRVACSALAAVAIACTSVFAQNRYRDGEPLVLTPPPAPPRPARHLPWHDLDHALARLRQRRVALFWEVALKGDVATTYDRAQTDEEHATRNGYASDDTLVDDEGSHRYAENGSTFVRKEVRHTRTHATNETPEDDALSLASRASQLQFMQELTAGGVRFVDRTLVQRMAGAHADGETPNVQAFEIEGLTRYADFILQVTSQPDAQANLGRIFVVSMRDLHSGQVLFEFMSRGDTPIEPVHGYVPGKDGFEHRQPRRPSPAETLDQLAIETGEHLLSALHSP